MRGSITNRKELAVEDAEEEVLSVAAGDAVAFVVGGEGIGVDPEVVAEDTIHTTRYRCLGGFLVAAKTLCITHHSMVDGFIQALPIVVQKQQRTP